MFVLGEKRTYFKIGKNIAMSTGQTSWYGLPGSELEREYHEQKMFCNFTSAFEVLEKLNKLEKEERMRVTKKGGVASLSTISASIVRADQTNNTFSSLLASANSTKVTFNVGDEVILKNDKSSRSEYTSIKSNPFWGGVEGRVTGKIISIEPFDTYPIRVKWNNGHQNSYKPEHLARYSEVLDKKLQEKVPGKKSQMKPKVSFDSVIVPEEKKTQILSALAQQDHTETIFEKWGFKNVFEKGTAISFIFFGPPGTGKTLMAEAIAGKYNQPLFMVGAAEIESSKPGEAERNIKRAFRIASGKEGKPSAEKDDDGKPKLLPKEKMVLLFDECDSLITNRKNVGIILASQINTLLSELERYEGIVIFTTNRLGSLDPAMERRITEKVEFEFPNKELRVKIWERMIPKKAPIAKDVDFKTLAEFPLAGGNIKNCVLNAARHAAYQEDKEIYLSSFVYAVEKEIEGMKSFQATKKYTGEVASNEGAMRQEIEKVESGEVEVIE